MEKQFLIFFFFSFKATIIEENNYRTINNNLSKFSEFNFCIDVVFYQLLLVWMTVDLSLRSHNTFVLVIVLFSSSYLAWRHNILRKMFIIMGKWALLHEKVKF